MEVKGPTKVQTSGTVLIRPHQNLFYITNKERITWNIKRVHGVVK